MNLREGLESQSVWTKTENGNDALNTTGNALVNLFGVIGALRSADETRITTLFAEAYKEDPLLATKMLFYARDIRGGLGERQTFRTILKYAANHHPEAISENIYLIPEYGRFDDWYELIDTPLEDQMWKCMKSVFDSDLKNMEAGKPVTLLAKWMKTADSSQSETRKLGIKTACKLGMTVYVYKRRVRALRKYLKVVEVSMCQKAYENIVYESVPSKAMLKYRNAFLRNDTERFNEYMEKLKKGEAKINSGTLYPYDLIKKYRTTSPAHEDTIIEEQWKALPNYLEGVENTNVLVMCDVSGSMTWSKCYPMDTSIGLAIYFAEHNTGMFKDTFMAFSTNPKFVVLRGETLYQKYRNIANGLTYAMGYSTDLRNTFLNLLGVAKEQNIKPSDMPAAICIITDMEIDGRTYNTSGGESSIKNYNQTFYNEMKAEFAALGYEIPNIIFWNVDSRNDTYHAEYDVPGVQFVSGSTPASFTHMLTCLGYNAYDSMIEVLSSERYSAIKIAE
jgi:hypothetical protein